MANYAQMNPGKYHLGHRFPTPVLIEKLPMHAEDEYRVELKYKHAVIVNRTAYVGNVQVFSRRKGSIKVEGDAMYKSIVNEFDTFASYNKIEAAVNDGEEITGLVEFADKILQFKQNTLYVINVSRQIEVLESTHKHKGVSNPAAICKTDYGIAWANKHGCYLYDGRKVVDILEKGGIRRIKESTWSSFVSSDGVMIGYFPEKKHLIVVRDSRALFTLTGSIDPIASSNVTGVRTKFLTEINPGDTITVSGQTRTVSSISSDTNLIVTSAFSNNANDATPDCNPRGDAYIYDMITASWSNLNGAFVSAIKSNFITDWNGDLVHSTSNTPKKWSNASAATSALNFQTKDIDFGHPSVRKKIYKVYISYKGDARNVQVQYGVDGDTPSRDFYLISSDGSTTGGSEAAKCLNFSGANGSSSPGTNDWLKAELKPSSSINNINSFRLKISGDGSNNIASDFEINDISIIYRIKRVK